MWWKQDRAGQSLGSPLASPGLSEARDRVMKPKKKSTLASDHSACPSKTLRISPIISIRCRQGCRGSGGVQVRPGRDLVRFMISFLPQWSLCAQPQSRNRVLQIFLRLIRHFLESVSPQHVGLDKLIHLESCLALFVCLHVFPNLCVGVVVGYGADTMMSQ